MSLDPNWDAPRTKHEDLLKYLKDLQTSIDSKGKIKPKKLQQMTQVRIKKYFTNVFKFQMIFKNVFF